MLLVASELFELVSQSSKNNQNQKNTTQNAVSICSFVFFGFMPGKQ